jgi:polar amino acid transport system permease protein
MAVDATGAGSEVRPPKARPTDQPGRLSFRTKVAMVWVGIFILLAIFFSLANFDVAWMRENAVFILKGLWVTLFIAALSIVLACILALFGALGRLSKNPIAYGISGFYTSFFRGTPLIVQLFLLYLAVPQIANGLKLGPGIYKYFVLSVVLTGILVLGLNYGAYMTEIFRAGILSVGHGQAEAADALGMTYRQRMRRVVLPQAFKVVIPPTANEFIAMTKDTALLGFLGAQVFWWDVFQRARIQGNADFRNLEALLMAAGVYWILTIILTFFQAKLERRVGKGYVREEVAARKSRWLGGGGSGGLSAGGHMVEIPAQPGMPPAAPVDVEEQP